MTGYETSLLLLQFMHGKFAILQVAKGGEESLLHGIDRSPLWNQTMKRACYKL